MNETIRLMKSHFLFAVLRKKPSKKLTSRKFYQLGRWHQVGKLSVLFCYCGQKQGKERSSLRLSSSRSDSPISRLSPLCWGFKPRWKSCQTS